MGSDVSYPKYHSVISDRFLFVKLRLNNGLGALSLAHPL